ncbi:helix-turn-helix domain-containing protein [Streptomyces sp. NPDC047079]|uniref:helix-turn-helix domain-containing protein n=1 Tax=Streptomyces sp. NPDC047079 TaxID=3154607 RepID=UPI0033E79A69
MRGVGSRGTRHLGRQLHRLFHRAGESFAAWLRRRRLDRIRPDLLDPAHDARTIAVVAARWGIHDPRHLARASRRSTGRRHAICGAGGGGGTAAAPPVRVRPLDKLEKSLNSSAADNQLNL